MNAIFIGWKNFWSFVAQFLQDSNGKSSSTRLTGYVALLTLVCEIVRAHGLPVDSGTLYTLVATIGAAFGFKIYGEKQLLPPPADKSPTDKAQS